MELPSNVQADVDKVQGRVVQTVEGPWLRLRVQYEPLDAAGLRAELAGLEATLRAQKSDAELLAWAKRSAPQLSGPEAARLKKRYDELGAILAVMEAAP